MCMCMCTDMHVQHDVSPLLVYRMMQILCIIYKLMNSGHIKCIPYDE